MIRRILLVCGGGAALLLLTGLLSLSVGSIDLGPAELLQALLHPGDGEASLVVWELRLPRILLGMCVGASLSLAGVVFQSLLRNPLADPYIVGTSAGAALGAAVMILVGWAGWLTPLAAFCGALGATQLVYRLARRDGYLPLETFLLAGVMVSSFLGSMVSLLLSLAREDMPRVVLWMLGSLANARWEQLAVVSPLLLVGAAGAFALSLRLNVLTLGEETAATLGVDVERLKVGVLVLGSLLTATSVSVAGLVGFVGLVVPHVGRRLVGSDHRVLLPASALLGASFVVLADALARWVLPGAELPVGVITALVGAPFFLSLLRRQR